MFAATLTVGSTLIPLFEQLGIAEELYRVGKLWIYYYTYNERRELIMSADFSLAQGLYVHQNIFYLYSLFHFSATTRAFLISFFSSAHVF